MPQPAEPLALCTDDDLGYQRGRTRFLPGAGFAFDESYRLAHLPLVAPEHPLAIPARPGTFYDRGRHPTVTSLVLPVPVEDLLASPAYRDLDAALRAAPFARKIAWMVAERRRPRLHATLCGGLAVGEAPFALDPAQRAALAEIGPITVELRGLFSGNLNLGRLYLRAYPESRGGENVVRILQRRLGRKESDLYVVGLHNLIEELDPDEAAGLDALIAAWWERPILRFRADRLWLLRARDDLVLDGEIGAVVPLASRGGGA
ncbi:hypothetical protein [Methylobacterium sp. JK268]